MGSSIFSDKGHSPDDRAFAAALGPAWKLWLEIRKHVELVCGTWTGEWKHYGAKSGWILKSLAGKRNMFFLTPCEGYFRLGFVFGDKAVAAIEASGLPAGLVAEVRDAKKYAEGRGLRLEVRTPGDVAIVKKLIIIKAAG